MQEIYGTERQELLQELKEGKEISSGKILKPILYSIKKKEGKIYAVSELFAQVYELKEEDFGKNYFPLEAIESVKITEEKKDMIQEPAEPEEEKEEIQNIQEQEESEEPEELQELTPKLAFELRESGLRPKEIGDKYNLSAVKIGMMIKKYTTSQTS